MSEDQIPTEPLTDRSTMPFGMHKGKALANIPAAYFIWLHDQGCNDKAIKQYIINNLEALKNEANRAVKFKNW